MSILEFDNISFVVFDLDGTLVDAFGDIHAAVNYALNRMGVAELDLPTVRGYVGNGVEMLMRRALATDNPERVQRGVAYWKEYSDSHPADHANLYPGGRQFLESLHSRNIRMGVMSNKVHDVTMEVLKSLGIESLFDVVCGDRGDHALKPDPALLLQMIRGMKQRPEKTLVVGDGAPDVLVAKAAGTWSCGAAWGLRSAIELRALGADIVVNNFQELKVYFHLASNAPRRFE